MRDILVALNHDLELTWGVQLTSRTGVNTGEVVAGDHRRGHQFVTGEAVTSAKRLEEAGAPGEILIGAATQRLVRDAVKIVPSGPRPLKPGQTLHAFTVLQVLAHAPGRARSFDAPFIGRELPRALLRAMFDETVRTRTSHLLTVSGMPDWASRG